MVESARRKDIIDKLQYSLKQKTIKINEMRRELIFYTKKSDSQLVENTTVEENEFQQTDEKEQDPQVRSIVNIVNGREKMVELYIIIFWLRLTFFMRHSD